MEKYDFENLTGEQWVQLLCEHPEFADKCDWDNLYPHEWSKLLAVQPQFVEKCKLLDKLDDISIYDWVDVLKKQPQLFEYYNYSAFDGWAWARLLNTHPQFSDKCNKWDDFSGDDWCILLKSQPQFAETCDWSKLNKMQCAYIVYDQPQLISYCNAEDFDGWDWTHILYKQPQLSEYCSWEKLDDRNWAILVRFQPQFLKTYIQVIFVPVVLIALLWGAGLWMLSSEKCFELPIVTWWTLLCGWGGVYYSMRNKNSELKWKWDIANIIAWLLLMPCSIIGYMIYCGIF